MSIPSLSFFISASCCIMVLLHESSAAFWNSSSGSSMAMLLPLCLVLAGNLGAGWFLVRGTDWSGIESTTGWTTGAGGSGCPAVGWIATIDVSPSSGDDDNHMAGNIGVLSEGGTIPCDGIVVWGGAAGLQGENTEDWWLEDVTPGVVWQAAQNQGSLFQLLPCVPLLTLHLLWNTSEHLLQARGLSLTWLELALMVEWQEPQDQLMELAEERMALLTLSIDCWLAVICLAARGSIRLLTSHSATEVPGVMIAELCTWILSFVW